MSIGASYSQTEQPYNMYNFEPVMLNPGVTGLTGNLSAFLDYRKQWVGFEGAPESVSGAIQSGFSKNMGIGLVFSNAKSSVFSTLNVSLNYSYTIKLDENSTLSPGIFFGIKNNNLQKDALSSGMVNDPILTSNNFEKTVYTSGFGMRYKMKNLIADFGIPVLASGDSKKLFQSLLGFVSYDFYTAGNLWKIQPSVLYRNISNGQTVNFNIQNLVDFNFLIEYKKFLWAQTSYRTNKDILLVLGFRFNKFALAYAYEITNSSIENVSSGSHEIALKFNTPISFRKNNEPISID